MVGQFLSASAPSAAPGLSWRRHQDPGISSALGHQCDYPHLILRRFCRCVICIAGSLVALRTRIFL